MGGRGARARKVAVKQVEKEEIKQADKEYKNEFGRPAALGLRAGSATPTPRSFAQQNAAINALPARKGSVLSSGTSIQSDDSERSKTSSAMDKLSAKLGAHGPEKKYVNQSGRSTAAPRGRNGGVPMKIKEVEAIREDRRAHREMQREQRQVEEEYSPPESSAYSLRSNGTTSSWEGSKIYFGNGQPPKRFGGFAKEEDLWIDDGDCLVYFHEEADEENPAPLLRVHAKVLARARSAFLDNLLKYGELIQEDIDATPLADSTSALPPRLPAWPLTSSSLGSLDQLLSSGNNQDAHEFPIPPRTPEIRSHRSTGSHEWSDAHTAVDETPRRGGDGIRIPASISEAGTFSATGQSDAAPSNDGNAEPEITHEIWFRAPTHIKRPDVQRRHHLATRNFIALLYGLPIVGNDFFEMLSDLQNVMETYYELNEPGERWNTTQVMIQYLIARKLDDVRNDLPVALGLLTWCEQPNVGWDAGWLEAFVHSVGMLTPRSLENRDLTRNLSPATKHRLSAAYSALQHKLSEAEGRLERFNFEELWYIDGITPEHPAQVSFDACREALFVFYSEQYGRWPPPAPHKRANSVSAHQHQSQNRWLSRELVQRLQIDFGFLYDWLVDRDITWEASEERHTRKWEMISKHPRGLMFEADAPGLPLTSMLIGFDSSQRYEHLLHPYPLLPTTSRSGSTTGGAAKSDAKDKDKSKEKKRGLLGGLSSKISSSTKKSNEESLRIPDAKMQYQLSLAFNSATNAARLGSHFASNKLIDAMTVHEKTAALTPSCTPMQARLGRWILLYGILQVLSTVSVDTAGLKYSDGVRYFVSSSLEGCPPWRSEAEHIANQRVMMEACQQRSYCWLTPKTWKEPGRPVQRAEMPTNDFAPPTNAFRDMSVHPQPSLTGLTYRGMPNSQPPAGTAITNNSHIPLELASAALEQVTQQRRPRDAGYLNQMSVPAISSPAPPAYSPASPSLRPVNNFQSGPLSGNAFAQTSIDQVTAQNSGRLRLPLGESASRRNRDRHNLDPDPHPLQAPHLHRSPNLSQHSDQDDSDANDSSHSGMGNSQSSAIRQLAAKAGGRNGFLGNSGLGIERTSSPSTSSERLSSRSARPLGHSVVVSSPHGEIDLRSSRPSRPRLPALLTRASSGSTTSPVDSHGPGSPSLSPIIDYAEFDALAAGAGTGLVRLDSRESRNESLMGRSEKGDHGAIVSTRQKSTEDLRAKKRSTLQTYIKSPLRMPGQQTPSPVTYSPFPTSPVERNTVSSRTGLGSRGGKTSASINETLRSERSYYL